MELDWKLIFLLTYLTISILLFYQENYMSITPDSVKDLLDSEDLGKRLKAVNQIRQLEPKIAL